jgi:hypothetical protein
LRKKIERKLDNQELRQFYDDFGSELKLCDGSDCSQCFSSKKKNSLGEENEEKE